MNLPQPVKLSGSVTRFKGDGRRLGYPTANLTVQTELEDGVYFGFADLARWHHQPSMIFVGTPTTMGETVRRIEAHLLDIPDKDYYDQMMGLEIRHFHRPNRTLKNAGELSAIMSRDEAAARQWFTAQTA